MSNLRWPGWGILNLFTGLSMKIILLFSFFIFSAPIYAKTLFLGDSLTAVYEKSAKCVLDEK